MALRPFSGSRPACAARPVISTVMTAEPFRVTSRLSGGTPRSRLMAASLSLAFARIRSRVPTEPVSSLFENQSDLSVIVVFDVTQDAQRAHGADDSRLVIASTWPDPTVADNSVGSLRHGPVKEYCVHVCDEQNMALTRACHCGDNIVANGW